MKNFTSLLFLFILIGVKANAQLPVLQLDSFSSGYSVPIDVENCGDNRLFIVQQSGQIFICSANGKKLAQPFLDISDRVSQNGGEQGLLGLAFDPHYNSNGYFYVNYINNSGNTQISRFTKSPGSKNTADPSSEFSILQVQQPFANHNGGCLRFGPDGLLYIGLGDGGSGGDPNNNAQNPMSLLGKMLRINVHAGSPYKIPNSNPFVDSTNYRGEIWNLGLRNPFRFSFDRQSGDLWIGDVGQSLWEEVDLQAAGDAGGENYGWRCYEGNHSYNTDGCNAKNTYTFPLTNYPHQNGDCAVIGGFVYRGSLYPNMVGKYFFADYCSGSFKMLYNEGGNWKRKNLFDVDDYSFVSFGESSIGELYAVNQTTGVIYHLTDKSAGFAKTFSSLSSLTAQIYPNPSSGNFSVSFNNKMNNDKIIINVYNALGKKIYESEREVKPGTNSLSISLSSAAKGNYYIQLSNKTSQVFSGSVLIN